MALGGVLPDTTAVNVLVVVAASGLIWLGSGWLEEAAEGLSTHYGLPPIVQGTVVVAVGSSFPEFASVVVTALAGVFDMGVGAIVGSAIFNVLVVPALSSLATDDDLDSSRAIVYKEAQFYMLAVSVLVITFALAVIYEPVAAGAGGTGGADGGTLTGSITRPLAVIPLSVYGLYLFIQWQDTGDYEAEEGPTDVPVLREWGMLVAGLLLILVSVEAMVSAIESLGHTFGIPEFLAGITIVAAATSLPDTLVSVRSARDDNSATSLGNVLGSNTFDLLVVIPVGVLIVGAVPVNFSTAVPMFAVLTLATVLLFGTLRTDLSLTTLEAYSLLVTYGLFVAWVVAETAGVTHVLPA
ncbi:sodium:calcium antiporter [Halorubrum sp. 48-1-W]|uniref:sodium:calcium antiporter n=1 Tax=Halorubrum sp. 48-1-W TaxID=2249761 RepID=UPI000DCE9DA5|nr:sodium:calcium antiporter [Halorubrum sp. 48-1-W]RAW45781.1 sodium:calcium antiporter [Halorubrum sp. 48-1-W]